MFGSRVGFSGTADRMALFPVQKIQDGGRRHVGKISNGHTVSPQPVVRSTSSLVLRWGFRGRRIQWRYFRIRNPRWRPLPSWISDGTRHLGFRMAISPQRLIRTIHLYSAHRAVIFAMAQLSCCIIMS